MPSLGARDAVNLDGGGSTTMTIRGTVVAPALRRDRRAANRLTSPRGALIAPPGERAAT
jgi:exopolysaccharide biosynthesis protein